MYGLVYEQEEWLAAGKFGLSWLLTSSLPLDELPTNCSNISGLRTPVFKSVKDSPERIGWNRLETITFLATCGMVGDSGAAVARKLGFFALANFESYILVYNDIDRISNGSY